MYIVNNKTWIHKNTIDLGDYEINELFLSTISTPSAGYEAGILNNDGREKSKRSDLDESK